MHAGAPRAALERAHSHPHGELSYAALSHMSPHTYRNHAWAQLAKSDTFYVRGSPEERRLQQALGLLDDDAHADLDEEEGQDLEAQGRAAFKTSESKAYNSRLELYLMYSLHSLGKTWKRHAMRVCVACCHGSACCPWSLVI